MYLIFSFMLPNGYIKLKYKHVAFRHWPPELRYVAFNLYGGYLPTYLVRWLTFYTMPKMTIRKNHASGLKSETKKFQPCPKAFQAKNS